MAVAAFREFQEPERDINAQILELIRSSIPTGSGWSPSVVAEQIVTELRADDPELLDLWLRDNAAKFIQSHLTRILSADRSKARTSLGARSFQAAAARFAAGDIDALSVYELSYAVEDGTQKLVMDMIGRDHLYIAERFGMEAKPFAMLEAFHKAVAKKVGTRKTSEVFTQEKYEAMYKSIVQL
jgi:hypothetical protein